MRLLTSSIISLVLLCGQFSMAELQERTIRFPEARSLGSLYTASMNEPATAWDFLSEARGDVTLPADKEIRLEVTRANASDLASLKQLPPEALQSVAFEEVEVEAEQLRHAASLPGLRELSFRKMRVRGEMFDVIASASGLERLCFCEVSFPAKDLARLDGLKTLKALSLEKCRIRDNALAVIGRMTHLEKLILSGTQITDAGLAPLASLASLRTLDLANTAITNAGLEQLKGLTQLVDLKVPAAVTPAGLETLRDLPVYDALTARKACLIKVIDAKDQTPLEGVTLKIRIDEEKSEIVTDASGAGSISMPEDAQYLLVDTVKEGFVPMRLRLDKKQAGDFSEEYVIEAEAGTTIGGRVVNEAGEPVPEASISLLLPSQEGLRANPGIWDKTFQTDQEGRWKYEYMPSTIDGCSFKVEHKDYISDAMYVMTPQPPMEELRALTAVTVLKKGVTVRGRVLDEQGNPVARAEVLQGEDRWGSDYPDTRTDASGVFEFANTPEGPMTLTVLKDGFAPELLQLHAAPGLEEIAVTLLPGKTISMRLQDAAGAPIAGATVIADTWRKCRTLKWRGKSDRDGRLHWKSAPADAVMFDILKKEFMDLRNHPLTAGDEERQVIMVPPLRISGRVVDKASGTPLEAFVVIPGIDWGRPGDKAYWQRRDALRGVSGAYQIEMSYPYPGHLLRFEAEGYTPFVSRLFKNDEGAQTLDVALEKGEPISGVALQPDGMPAVSATVVLNAQDGCWMNNGVISNLDEAIHAVTDASGAFSFSPQEKAVGLFVLHETGYAFSSSDALSSNPAIPLVAWGRIEGQLLIGEAPGINSKIVLSYNQQAWDPNPWLHANYTTQTQPDGGFVFERVLKGVGRIYRGVPCGTDRFRYSHDVYAAIAPGETTKVAIGGAGRPVRGRFILPEDAPKPLDWNRGDARISLAEKPKHSPFTSEAAYIDWVRETKGKGDLGYALEIQSDGAFIANDVPAGDYVLSVFLHEPAPPGKCGYGPLIAKVKKNISVPAMPGGRSDEALDLGDIPVELTETTPTATLEPGTATPDFEAKNLEGEPLKRTDYLGKYLLLDFWATWCGPCRAETPYLKQVQEAFGNRPDFILLSLSIDKEVSVVKEFVEKEKMDWHHAILGDASASILPSFGVEGIPAILLVDPEGNLIAKDLRGDATVEAVRKALAEKDEQAAN